VLWVPTLSRRLLSVDQWMAAGGDTHFNVDYTTIRIVDSGTEERHSFNVPKPFASLPSNAPVETANPANTRQVAMSTPPPKKAVPGDLLHRRLGHRTMNGVIVGSKNEVWSDTTLRWESDNFCDSCQIVTARNNNRGKSPLDVGTLDMQPGESVMVDVVPNLNKHGLTTSSHWKHHVLVTDVKTRFAAPVGCNSKQASTSIATALATWATVTVDPTPYLTFITS
jgi:hypothetical protein